MRIPIQVTFRGVERSEALEETNWDLLRAAIDLSGTNAASIRDRLVEALATDELAVGLVGRLRDATAAATQLLATAAAKSDQPPLQNPATGQLGGGEPPVHTGGSGAGVLTISNFDRAAAQSHLEQVRERLRAEAQLDLTWQIEELPDDDS